MRIIKQPGVAEHAEMRDRYLARARVDSGMHGSGSSQSAHRLLRNDRQGYAQGQPDTAWYRKGRAVMPAPAYGQFTHMVPRGGRQVAAPTDTAEQVRNRNTRADAIRPCDGQRKRSAWESPDAASHGICRRSPRFARDDNAGDGIAPHVGTMRASSPTAQPDTAWYRKGRAVMPAPAYGQFTHMVPRGGRQVAAPTDTAEQVRNRNTRADAIRPYGRRQRIVYTQLPAGQLLLCTARRSSNGFGLTSRKEELQ